MKMRESKVLKKLRAGKVVNCTKFNLLDPRVTEIAAMYGFDCLWLDKEHVPTDWVTVENQIRSAKIYNVDTMVRVARGSYSDYIQPLEMDAAGIMVPHVMSLDDARKVVQMTRFHPIGRRPVDGGNADGSYTTLELKDYCCQANEQRFIVLQIEDPEPLDELEAIAALEGYDMLFFGPGDFSQGIGAPGDWDHPKLLETRKRIAEVAIKHGKFAGTTASIDNMEEFIDLGYKFLSVGADVVGMNNYYNNLITEFSNRIK
ncbi:MAG: hypothetical protein K8R35_05220 [Bacteroidales bacterium]|nr:hypothetical protein [Bacteroidales bacterium]